MEKTPPQHDLKNKFSVEEYFLKKSEIPHVPSVISRIIKLATDKNTSAEKLAEEIQKEPGLVIKVLKTVNSPFYGLQGEVGTVSHAISILGMTTLQNIALSRGIFDHLFEESSADFFDLMEFWRHSFFTAIAARFMARMKKYPVPEDAFIAGLLHDIGVLAMVRAEPEMYRKVLATEQKRKGKENLRSRLEFACFKTNHSKVGYLFAKQGNLPRFIQTSILYHNNPAAYKGRSSKNSLIISLVYLSDIIADILCLDNKSDNIVRFKAMAGKFGALTERQSEDVLHKISEEIEQSKSFFKELSISRQKTYSEILQEANTELGKINLKFDSMNKELVIRDKEICRINKELESEKDRLSRELLLAKSIHLSMVPAPIVTTKLDMDIYYEPMLGVGGDFADVYVENDNRICFAIADVTGHGLAAALISTRLEAEISSFMRSKVTTLEVIEALNSVLTEKFPETGHYLTAFCGIFDFCKNKLYFSGAAHPPGILMRGSSEVTLLKSQNSLIGLDSALRKKKGIGEVPICKGDRLFVYTDGLTERKDKNNEELGIEGLVAILKENALCPLKGFASLIVKEIEKDSMVGDHTYSGKDDRMAMAFQVK